jgi:xanthine dehydrogenase YagT iron-sulfur-binding subunit
MWFFKYNLKEYGGFMVEKPKTVKPAKDKKTGVNRRTFIKSVGMSSVGVAALSSEGLVGKLRGAGLLSTARIAGPGSFAAEFIVNQKKYITQITPQSTLADVLRENLHLTGTKIGCNRGACGACTVIVNGQTVASCLSLAVDAIGIPIETIEGLSDGVEQLHPLQESFIEHDAMQCGFCTPGIIMSSKNLLDENKAPSDADIRTAVSGNICRCGTYPHVFKAVRATANGREKK